MKWDYYTYIKQPDWFLEGLRKKLTIDAYQSYVQNKRLEIESRRKK